MTARQHCKYCGPVENRIAVVERLIDENESIVGDIEDQVVDLLANLRHFAEAHQLRFAPLLRLSKMHWEEERHGGGSHGE
jgi:hypothetical protein